MARLSMWITVASVLAAFVILPVVPQIPRQGQVGMGRDSYGWDAQGGSGDAITISLVRNSLKKS